jgi:hypothetical protein
MKRGYYRVARKTPTNRIDGPLADAVRAKFAEGWPKARIAREFRLNRRTVIRICAPLAESRSPILSQPALSSLVRCTGCGITIRRSILRAHWPNCPAVREGLFSLEECPV